MDVQADQSIGLGQNAFKNLAKAPLEQIEIVMHPSSTRRNQQIANRAWMFLRFYREINDNIEENQRKLMRILQIGVKN